VAPAVQPGGPLFGIEAGTREPLTFVAGGVPVTDDNGRLIGAIGVGGGMPDQDAQVADAALGHERLPPVAVSGAGNGYSR
jgi:uncharacterized protein GlcG (DUF336 family)